MDEFKEYTSREDTYRSKKTLNTLYVLNKLSAKDIGDLFGVQGQTIIKWLHKFDIPVRQEQAKTKFKPGGIPINKIDVPSERELRALYENGESTDEIGKRYNVTSTTAGKWLEKHGIKRRQMRNQAGWAPDHALLKRLYWDEWMSYEQIAERLGVDLTAVPYWFKKFGIKRRTVWETRRGPNWTPPDVDTVAHLYQAELMGMQSIGDLFDVSKTYVSELLKKSGVQIRRSGYPNVSHYTARDGHKVKSGLEAQVDDWLFRNGIQHDYEPKIPGTGYKSDFFANGHYIEVWGIEGNEKYEKRRKRKLATYSRLHLPLISVYQKDFPDLHVLESLLAE